MRLRKYLAATNLWTEENEKEQREKSKVEIMSLLQEMEHAPKVSMDELVTDVYHDVPPHLQEQKQFVDAIVKKYPEFYASGH